MIIKSVKLMGFAVMAQLAFSAPAQAQEVSELETGTVVISATRTEQMIEDVPQAMEVITAEQIEEMAATDMYDVLSEAANINISNQKGSVSIRGASFSDTLILIDGRKPARLESNHDGIGFILSSIGVSNIERVEIIRGQAGVMYGANATAGVINIITKKAAQEGGVLSVVGGNAGVLTGITYSTGRLGNWDALINAQFKQNFPIREEEVTATYTDGWKQTDEGDTLNLNTDIRYHFNDDHNIVLSGGYMKRDYRTDSNDGTSSTSQRINVDGALDYQGQTENHMFSLAATYSQSKHKPSVTTSKTYTFTNYGSEGKDTWFINDYNTLTFGYDYSHEHMWHSVGGYANIDRVGFYVQDEISLFDEKLFFVPGLRYDHDSQFGGQLTYQLGATYEFMPGHRFKANVGTSYVAPSLVQAYGYESRGGNAEVYGNPNIKPEHGFGWELRYEGEWKNVKGSIGYYRSEFKDQIGSEQTGVNALGGTVSSYINLDKSRLQGIETALDIKFLENFTLSLGYEWIDNYDISNKQRAAYYATNNYSLGLKYHNPDWDFTANIWGVYKDDFTTYTGGMSGGDTHDARGNPYVYDYYNVNLAFSKTWQDKYTGTLAFYNLLKTKRDSSNDGSVDPFEVRAGFSVKF